MTVVVAFPDIEAVLVAAITAAGTAAGTETPGSFAGAYVRVLRHGGGDDYITDEAKVTLDYFASTRAAASEGIRALIATLTVPGGLVVVMPDSTTHILDAIRTDTGPQEIPWNANNSPRRFVASFTVTARRT